MTTWELLQKNLQFYQSVMSQAEADLVELRMEIKSFFLLEAVDECKYPAELAKHCLLPKPTVSFIVKRLEKLGYLLRQPVVGDLRKFELSVTPKGRIAIEKAKILVSRAFERSLSRLTKQEREIYVSLLAKMQDG